MAAAEPLHGAGSVVFQDDVGRRRQPMQQRAAFVRFQVDGDAALVAIEGGEESGGKAEQPPGGVAVRRLDLDHIGAEIGQDQARSRAHDGVAEFEHANAGKRRRVVGSRLRVSHRDSLSPHSGACPGCEAGDGRALPMVRPGPKRFAVTHGIEARYAVLHRSTATGSRDPPPLNRAKELEPCSTIQGCETVWW